MTPSPQTPAGPPSSSIVDADCTQVIDGTMVKIYAWVRDRGARTAARAARAQASAQLGRGPARPRSPGVRPTRAATAQTRPTAAPPAPPAPQYDNEIGYATRLVDLAAIVVAKGL